MKKYILLLFIFCLQLMPAKAQWVTIPDTNFVNKLTQLYPSCMNGNQMDTTCSDIITSPMLFADYSNITDLTGVQYFDNLQDLYCNDNQLTQLPSLPNTLAILRCGNNQLQSLPNLPIGLYELQCENNQLVNLPSLPSNLSNLYCYNNQLNNLPLLPNSLFDLSCSNNLLTNLPSLPSNLSGLSCSYNQLAYLPALPVDLSTLECSNNLLTSLPNLPSTLMNLDCSYNQLTSIAQVQDTMFSFFINNNNINCLTNLPNNNGFVWLTDISNNPLTCVPNQTNYSLGLPVCIENDPINNPNYCAGVANITGYVYKDLDTNCSHTNIDWPSENIPVKVFDDQNNLLAISYTVNGAYSFTLLQPDTFILKIDDLALPFSMDCGQVNNQNIALDSANQTIQNINFPVVCDTSYDIQVNSMYSQGWVFPGQQHYVNVNITNNINWYNLNCSTINYSGTVSISITGSVTFVIPAPNALAPIVNGNIFTYNITDFSTLTPNSFGLQFLTDTTAQANDQICVHVEINPTPMDADTTNNSYDFCYQVVNSYDPNMKEVYPVNVLPGYDDWFTYTIHFQNTGNAPAFNIRLRDTLDTNLDINSFEMLGYSHPAIVSINGNILTVRFNNIMLPDSATDYEGSMGYFQYRLKPISNLPLGTQIENTAYIYFDYNDPIVTNTTQNNFQMVVSTFNNNESRNQLSVFPNPANEMLNIMLQNSVIENCIISNALGQSVYNSANEINANHKIQLNIANLSPGVYFVKVRASNGSYMAKFIKSE